MKKIADGILSFFLILKYIDEDGNRYYVKRKWFTSNEEKRLVKYAYLANPSKLPPKCYAWLHGLIGEEILTKTSNENFSDNVINLEQINNFYSAWKPKL